MWHRRVFISLLRANVGCTLSDQVTEVSAYPMDAGLAKSALKFPKAKSVLRVHTSFVLSLLFWGRWLWVT